MAAMSCGSGAAGASAGFGPSLGVGDLSNGDGSRAGGGANATMGARGATDVPGPAGRFQQAARGKLRFGRVFRVHQALERVYLPSADLGDGEPLLVVEVDL